MNPNGLAAAIGAGGAVIIAGVALLVNHRGFTMLDKRIDDLRADTGRRLTPVETDLREFFRVQSEHDKRTQRLEDKN